MIHPYATPAYARSLAHWGEALFVPGWETPVIVRDGGLDAAGMYPIAILSEKADIAGGLDYLRRQGLVSVVLVLDDFHRPPPERLKAHFPILRPFKAHHVFNREKGAIVYDTHHKRALKKSQAQVEVSVMDLKKDARRWQALYDGLIAQMHLSGLHAFPLAHTEAIADIPGITAIGAWQGGELVSCHIWAHDENTAHSHLVASNDKGYDSRAGFAVNDFSIGYFKDARILNFGGGAGNAVGEDDGLARFKRGFSNAEAQSYICGAILDKERYEALSKGRETAFFPAYRAPSHAA